MPKYRESDADIDFYNKFKIEEKILQAEKLLLKVQEILRQKPDLFEIAESSLNHLINDLEQRENSLELKRIEELTNKHFFVDSYQRGYKWKPQQVKALLDDIDEFKIEKSSDFYCLQPVVVKRTKLQDDVQYYWELIDGQQRMTTIFIILSYLNKDKFFHLRYETRKESTEFLNQLSNLPENASEIPLSTIDSHYFFEAYKAIQEWFLKKEEEAGFSREDWKSKLLKNTKVIWYAVRNNENEDFRKQSIEIFTRLNQGKIPLTDAELLKALFLQNVVKAYEIPEIAIQKQMEMANQWDLIEQSLQDNDFWAFLSPHKDTNKYTRIELIFDLIAQKSKLEHSAIEQDHQTFLHYANQFKSDVNSKEQLKETLELIWQDVLTGFQRLNEWYQDDRLYHLIGYLIGQKYKKIQDLWEAAKETKRDNFKHILIGFIGEELKTIFKQKKEDKEILAFEAIDYERSNARPKLISLLTLFNIYRHEQQRTRFPFKQYYACKWDIEHIHAQQSPELSQEDKLKSWFEDQNKIIDNVPSEDQARLRTALDRYRAANKDESDILQTEYLKELYAVVGDTSENVHTLDNLCLLPDEINRSIGNAPFFIKRQDIISSEQKWEHGNTKTDLKTSFIPLASQQVFSKYFSPNVNQMLKWGIADRDAYKKALINCFNKYGIQLNHIGMGGE
ncbi:hypothetical protein F989_01943 [Acinetobacter parvus NIPH 1103]|uniref:GmrSD restriction endonucleases N-terminal domain-containing protein n=1 Tax=Acinetobacter parvus NIPH 1103 TaxID=1217671 RepID=N8RG86_9GAMM|nr:hypothetical protein F989_01943 [Acinetobacter parvus NIPH 1103]